MNEPKVDYFKLRKHCPYCHKANIKLMTQLEFYGRDFDGGKLYVCQKCLARVGCHKGTEIPMGSLSDEELRQLRQEIHKIIDAQWKTKEEGLLDELPGAYKELVKVDHTFRQILNVKGD